jgi:hypothetical protein
MVGARPAGAGRMARARFCSSMPREQTIEIVRIYRAAQERLNGHFEPTP